MIPGNCDDSTKEPTKTPVSSSSGRRPEVNCDPTTLPAFDAIAPGGGAATPDVGTFKLLYVGNDLVELLCDDHAPGTEGANLIVPPNDIRLAISVDFLSSSVLTTIARDPDGCVAAALDSNADLLTRSYGMSGNQAAQMISTTTAAKAAANEAARSRAVGAIDCRYFNDTTVVTCPDGAMTAGYVNDAQVRNPVVVDAGIYWSKVSVEDANDQATAYALSALVCFFTHPEITVTCETELGMSGVVSDTDIPPYGERRVASVTIPAGEFPSSISTEDAEEQARVFAAAQLVCFYLNEPTPVTCGDPDHLHDRPVTYVSGNVGTDIIIPAGHFASIVSQEDANEQAISAGQTRLDCEFGNTHFVKTCPVAAVVVYGEAYSIPADQVKSPVFRVVVDENKYRSPVSQEDAQLIAADAAATALDCVYCNTQILPKCVEDAVTESILTGALTLPLAENVSGGSMDATSGVPAGYVCGTDAETVMIRAYDRADFPVRLQVAAEADEADACMFGNDQVNYRCSVPAIPYGTLNKPAEQNREVIISANTITITKAQVPVDFQPNDAPAVRAKAYANWLAAQDARSILECVYYSAAQTVTCDVHEGKPNVSPKSVGSSVLPVLIAAGEFYSPDSIEDANAQAVDAGKALLFCFYESKKARFLCGNEPYEQSAVTTADGITYGDGRRTPTDDSYGFPSAVASNATGSISRPVDLPAGLEVSFTSQLEADQMAMRTGIGQLDCFWENVAIEVRCGYSDPMLWDEANEVYNLPVVSGTGDGTIGIPGSTNYPVFVQAGKLSSYTSKSDATSMAYSEAVASLNCVWGSRNLSVSCDKQPRSEGQPSTWAGNAVTTLGAIGGSYLSYISQLDADTMAITDLRSNLQCLYTHEDVAYNADRVGDGGNGGDGEPQIGTPCGDAQIPVGVLKVQRDTFTALDPNTPYTMAEEHIRANQQCASSGQTDVTPYGWVPIVIGEERAEDGDKLKIIVNQYATLLKGTDYVSDCVTDIAHFSDVFMLSPNEFLHLIVYTHNDGSYSHSLVRKSPQFAVKEWYSTPVNPDSNTDNKDMTGYLIVTITALLPWGRLGAKAKFKIGDNSYVLPHFSGENFLLQIICDPETGERRPGLVAHVAGFNSSLP